MLQLWMLILSISIYSIQLTYSQCALATGDCYIHCDGTPYCRDVPITCPSSRNCLINCGVSRRLLFHHAYKNGTYTHARSLSSVYTCSYMSYGCCGSTIYCPANQYCELDCSRGCNGAIIYAQDSTELLIKDCDYTSGKNNCGNMEIYCPFTGRGGINKTCTIQGSQTIENSNIYTQKGFNDLYIQKLNTSNTRVYCGNTGTEYSCLITANGHHCGNSEPITCDNFILPTLEPTPATTPPTQYPTLTPTKAPTYSPTKIPTNYPTEGITFEPSNYRSYTSTVLTTHENINENKAFASGTKTDNTVVIIIITVTLILALAVILLLWYFKKWRNNQNKEQRFAGTNYSNDTGSAIQLNNVSDKTASPTADAIDFNTKTDGIDVSTNITPFSPSNSDNTIIEAINKTKDINTITPDMKKIKSISSETDGHFGHEDNDEEFVINGDSENEEMHMYQTKGFEPRETNDANTNYTGDLHANNAEGGDNTFEPEGYSYAVNKKKAKEVEEWLNSLEMNQYYEAFIQNGFDFMDAIEEIGDKNDLKEIGVLKGHQFILMKAIQKLKTDK